MKPALLSGEKYLRAMIDAFPIPVIIMDRERHIHDANKASNAFLKETPDIVLRRLCGDMMRCIHARQAEGGCGTAEHCPDCVLRQTAETVAGGTDTFRRLTEMQIEKNGTAQKVWFLVSGSRFDFEGRHFAIITLEDITEVVELRRMIPICSHCRKVRNDANFWQNVEDYLGKYMDVQFTHSICPDCAKEHYSDL